MATKVVVVVVGALASCAPTVEYVPLTNTISTRAVAPGDVAVYWRPPQCPYREIGFVETMHVWPTSHAEQLWELRTSAGQNGADGIIIADHHEPEGHQGHGGGGAGSFTAIAISGHCFPSQ